MKNVLLIICLFFASLTAQAQIAKFEFGLKGGWNFSQLALAKTDVPGGIRFGGNVGVTTTYTFTNNLFLQSGLSFTTKGAKIKGDAPIGFTDRILYPGREAQLKSNQMYVQTPLFIGYKIRVSPAATIVVNAGLYFAYGIGGKTELTGDIIYGDMIDYSTIEEPTFSNRGLKKFDYGIGTGIGVELGKTIISVGYELGMRNIVPTGDVYFPFYTGSYKNRNASLSLEYRF
ncbi:porin family protein [Spirosoma daeguense]